MTELKPTTRAKISLHNGSVELEGSEAFVRAYLDEYKVLLIGDVATRDSKPATTSTPPSQTRKSTPTKSKTGNKKTGNKKKTSKVSAERFDIHGSDNTRSLEDFIKEKKPGRPNAEKMLVIGYYISEVLGAKKFSEGQIEYAYKMLKYKRPEHLHQIMINAKNEKDWFEPVDENGVWALTRTGDIFVSDDLPRPES